MRPSVDDHQPKNNSDKKLASVFEGLPYFKLCRSLAVPLRIEAVPAVELADADEVFLSSTGGGVLPIAKIDGRAVAGEFPGPVTRRLQDAYWALHEGPRYRDQVAY